MLNAELQTNELLRRAARDDDPSPLITTKLHLSGDALDPKRCTGAAGVEPTSFDAASAVLPGVWMPSGRPGVRWPYWEVAIKNERSYSIDESLMRLLDLIWPRREAIVALVRDGRYKATFMTSVTIHEDRPLYSLSGETLRRLAYFAFDYSLDISDFG
jgi:hypothetical protein